MKKIYIGLFLGIFVIIFAGSANAQENVFTKNAGCFPISIIENKIEKELPLYQKPKIYIGGLLLLILCGSGFLMYKKYKRNKKENKILQKN